LFIDLLSSRVNDLLKPSEHYRIGRLFWPILSTIGFSHNRPNPSGCWCMCAQVKSRPRQSRPTCLAETALGSSAQVENRVTELGSDATEPCNIELFIDWLHNRWRSIDLSCLYTVLVVLTVVFDRQEFAAHFPICKYLWWDVVRLYFQCLLVSKVVLVLVTYALLSHEFQDTCTM